MTTPASGQNSSSSSATPASPEVGPAATQDVAADEIGGIDLTAMFGDPSTGSGHSSVEQTEGGGNVHGGIELGGGANASIGIPGGPSISLGAEGEFGTQGGFGAEGRHLEADSTQIDSTTVSGEGEVSDAGSAGEDADPGWQDSSLTLDEGSVAAGGETYLGGGAEASLSAPGLPEFGAGINGDFSTEGGFEFSGSHLDADTSYGEGEPPQDQTDYSATDFG